MKPIKPYAKYGACLTTPLTRVPAPFLLMSTISTGQVKLSKLEANNPLKAKLSAQGEFLQAGSADVQPFQVVFDGKTISKIRSDQKSLVYKTLTENNPAERSLGFVTSFLGGGAYHLLMLEYILDQPFRRQLAAPVVEYEGRTSVNGVLCHVIYLDYLRCRCQTHNEGAMVFRCERLSAAQVRTNRYERSGSIRRICALVIKIESQYSSQ